MYNESMQAKIINTEEINIIDIIKANFLIHRFLSGFYGLLFVFFMGYFSTNMDALLSSASVLLMGLALITLTAWIGFIGPIFKAFIWFIKLRLRKLSTIQKLTISFFDIYLKVDNDTLDSQFKLEYKNINKVIETKKQLLIVFGYNNFIIVKKSTFAKSNDLAKLKGYLARFNLVRNK